MTKLYLDSAACPSSALTWHALYLTEFFNERVHRAAYIDDSIPDGLPIERVDVGEGGGLVRRRTGARWSRSTSTRSQGSSSTA